MVVKICSIGILYFAAGKFGLSLTTVHPSATLIWAPTGIAIASMLLYGYRVWPGIFFAACVVNLTTSHDVASSFGIAAGNTFEAIVATYLTNRFANGSYVFRRSFDHSKFIFLAAPLGAVVSASVGLSSLLMVDLLSPELYGSAWLSWFFGDLSGALIVTPCIILWARKRDQRLSFKYLFEALLLVASTVMIGFIGLASPLQSILYSFPPGITVLPPLLWAAFRFGPRETITIALMLNVFALVGVLNGFGPFARASITQSLLLTQIFMSIATSFMLSIATVISRLRKAESRFRALIEHSSDVVSMTNTTGNVSYVSPSIRAVLGYAPEELLGMSGNAIVHPDDLKWINALFLDLAATAGKVVKTELRVKRKDGLWVWGEVTIKNALHDPDVAAVVTHFRDITARKQDERLFMAYHHRLMKEKANTEALIGSISDGILAADRHGHVSLANQAFLETLGLSEDEIKGRHISAIMVLEKDGVEIPERERPLSRAIRERQIITAECVLRRKDGTKIFAMVTATPVYLDGNLIGGVKIIRLA